MQQANLSGKASYLAHQQKQIQKTGNHLRKQSSAQNSPDPCQERSPQSRTKAKVPGQAYAA